MLKRNHPRSGGLSVRILGSLALLAAVGTAMYFALPKETAGPGSERANTPKQDDKAKRCEDQLADLLEAMSPGRLGISSDRVQVIDRLNAWHSECGSSSTNVQPSNDTDLLKKLLAGDTLSQTLSDRYLAEDASHIRMSMLARDIVTNVVEGNTSNVDRTASLFDFISRNVMLINEEIRDTTELTPYECLIFGMGTAEDRAWIFAELLRQIRTDVVILTPRTEEKAEHWLIGVIDPQQGVLLFDPRLGLPIPAAGSPVDTPYPNVPATLQSVRESDAAFRQLDVPDFPYPLTSADMQDLNVSVIGNSCSWAPRMALLQFLLPQGVSVDLYDGIGKNEFRSPGLLERVVQAGQNGLWNEDHVSVWAVPEQAEAKFEATHGEGQPNSQLFNLQYVFKGPYVQRPDGNDGKKVIVIPIEKSLHYVRIEQLKGKFNDAIRDFLPVRTTVKATTGIANEMAAQFGTLWTGQSQLKTQKIRTAIGTLDRFLTSQVHSVGMVRTGVEYLADCFLLQKNYQLAAEILEKAPAGFAPQRDLYLIRRWKKLAGIDPDAKKEDSAAPETPAAEAKPNDDAGNPEMKAEPAPADASGKPAEAEMPAKPADETTPAPAAEDKPAEPKPAEPAPEAPKPEATPEPAADPKPAETPEPAENAPAPEVPVKE